jgi:hypothetical protein
MSVIFRVQTISVSSGSALRSINNLTLLFDVLCPLHDAAIQ